MIEVLTMPFPAAWKAGLLDEDYAGLTLAESLACQALTEHLRHDGYAIVGLASTQPRLTTQYRLHGGNTDSGMVLDFVVHGGQPIPKERDLL